MVFTKRAKKGRAALCAMLLLPVLSGCGAKDASAPAATPALLPLPSPAAAQAGEAAATEAETPLALDAQEIRAAQELLLLLGPYDTEEAPTKERMLDSLSLYTALLAADMDAVALSAGYDAARNRRYVWYENAAADTLCMGADTAAAFALELFGSELPLAHADYFDAETNGWLCKDGVYSFHEPPPPRWRLRQDSYTVDKESGVYTMRLIKYYPGAAEADMGAEAVEARFVRAENRWGLALLDVHYERAESLAALFAEQADFAAWLE